MLKNFSKNEKLFLLHNFILIFPLSISNVFISFFIWDKTNDLSKLAIFYVINAIGIVVGALFASYFAGQIKSSFLRAFGILITSISIGILFVLGDNAINFILPIALLFGIAIGMRALPYRLLFQKIIFTENREKFFNIDNTVASIIGIVLPLLAAILIGKSNNYSLLFGFSFLMYLLAVFPTILIKDVQGEKTKFAIGSALAQFKTDPDLRTLGFIKIVDGMRILIHNSIWAIIVLNIVGSMQNWGIYNTIFAIIATIITYTLGRRIKFSNSKQFAMFMGILMAVVGLILASGFDLPSYILFSFVASIAETLYMTGYQSIESKVIDRNVLNSEYMDEIYFFFEIALSIGRILPALVIIATKPDFNDDLSLRLFIILLAVIPLTISSLISKVNVAKRSLDPFVNS